MRSEDKYAAGLAAGTGLAGAGAFAAFSGSRLRQQGRSQARANAGSQGQTVRGGRLVRSGNQMVREGNDALGKFKRVDSKNGKTLYKTPNGQFAQTKGIFAGIERGNQARAGGGAQIAEAKTRRVSAIEGLRTMRRGRLITRGGLGAAALGGVVAAGSVAAGERQQNKRRAALRRVAPVVAAPSAQDYRDRANAVQGGLLRDAAGGRAYVPGKPVSAKQRAYMERAGLVGEGASERERSEALRSARLNVR